MQNEEIRPTLTQILVRLDTLKESLNLAAKEIELGELELRMNAKDFWDNQELANNTLKTVKAIRELTVPWTKAHGLTKDALEMLDLAEMEADQDIIDEVATTTEELQQTIEELDIKSLLRDQYDNSNVFFSIHAGAGGTESCDWAQMLHRMYDRFFERHGYKASALTVLPGDGAGIKGITLKVEGDFAYGYLKSEIGVHRLVRISPFDSNKRRHTSFVSVDVIPEITDEIDVEINPKDIRLDTYRASGAGGQHVNKTDSAVRITHLETNIVVQCQSERSQMSNKATAMKMLQAKLWQHEEIKRQDELSSLNGQKSSISWGSQIRSYVLQPYQMIKDHRTDLEIGNIQAVLDGDIFQFLKKYLQWSVRNSD
ncbi:MAG: peptide chain release factor 2 [Planctomycetes bacterium]|nr:peptide chain release factor 2 [Planctomycetota bacterium]